MVATFLLPRDRPGRLGVIKWPRVGRVAARTSSFSRPTDSRETRAHDRPWSPLTHGDPARGRDGSERKGQREP